jgi:hypothetical protein
LENVSKTSSSSTPYEFSKEVWRSGTKEQRHGGMRGARPVLKSGTYNEYLGKKVKCTDTPLFLEAVNTNRRNICHVTSLGCGILQILNKC